MKQNVEIFFEENPTATFEDFQENFGSLDNLSPEMLEMAFSNSPGENLASISRRKRMFQLITLVSILAVLAWISYFAKSYIDFLDGTPVSVEYKIEELETTETTP